MNLKVKKLLPEATLPTRAHVGDLGFDLYAVDTVAVQAGETKLVKTGIACQFPEGWGGIVKARSSQGKAGINVLGGVIDGKYIGEIGVLLHNTNIDDNKVIIYSAGEKVGQLVLIPVFMGGIMEVQELEETSRGEKGFGSSGR